MRRTKNDYPNKSQKSFFAALFFVLVLAPDMSHSAEKLPSLVRIIFDTLLKTPGTEKAAVAGDPWARGRLIAATRAKYSALMDDAGLFRHVGRRVIWNSKYSDVKPFSLDSYTITRPGLYGAVWLVGIQALKDYLVFRARQGWRGPITEFPPKHALAFRKVEAGMLIFRNALFDNPVVYLTFKRNDDPTLLPILRMLHDRVEASPNKKPSDAEVARFDLNRDGKLDSLVFLRSLGVGACNPEPGSEINIFVKAADGWKEVGKTMTWWDSVAVIADPKRALAGLYGGRYVSRWLAEEDRYEHHCESPLCWAMNDPREELGAGYRRR